MTFADRAPTVATLHNMIPFENGIGVVILILLVGAAFVLRSGLLGLLGVLLAIGLVLNHAV